MNALWHDLRYAFRILLKKPSFTAVIILTLALGIGANTAIFSVVSAVVLRPLPYHEPDRLAVIWDTKGERRRPVTYPNFGDWRNQNEVFEDMGVYRPTQHALTREGKTERIEGARVSGGFFRALRVEPALGRIFRPEEDLAGAKDVAIVSHGLWQRRFGGDPALLGQTLRLGGDDFTVVGILPRSFDFPLTVSAAEVWTPTARDADSFSERSWHWLGVVARLKPGVTQEQAQAQMDTIARRLEQQYPDSNAGLGVRVVGLHEEIVGDVRPALFVLLGSVGLVLLIACANVGNLLLARSADRSRELAVRAAMGARRARLIRQLLTESVSWGLAGGVLGMLLSLWCTEGLLAILPSDLPRVRHVGLNWWVLGCTLVLALLSGLLSGLASALYGTRSSLYSSLKKGVWSTAAVNRNRLRGILVTSEVALTVVLLIAAGLLVRSFQRLTYVDPGFDPENVLSFQLSVPPTEDSEPNRRSEFHRQVIERMAALSGVVSAGASTTLPLSGTGTSLRFRVEGRPEPPPGEEPQARYDSISNDYFQAFRVPLVAGRFFGPQDVRGQPGVMIINDAMARRFFPNEDPIGQRVEPSIILDDGGKLETFEVVGIVGNMRSVRLNAEPLPCMYVPFAQQTWSSMYFALRTTDIPMSLVGAIRSAVSALTNEEAPYDFRTMRQRVTRSVGQQRFSTVLVGIFALMAVTLAAIGMYGVLSYSVAQRTHEIGTRMALGAQQSTVLCQVLRQGLTLTAVGLGIGLAASLASTRVLSSQLYAIGTTDPVTFVGVPVLLSAVALFACYIPARRATRIDPLVALRCE